MKILFYLVCLIWLSFTASAQSVFSNQTNAALQKVIEDYRITEKKYFSWERELYTSSDFDKARQKFGELYQNLHNTIIKFEGEKPVILNGSYEAPTRARKQNSINFQFLPATGVVQKLKVELVLRQLADNWAISLMVYEPAEADFKMMSAVY